MITPKDLRRQKEMEKIRDKSEKDKQKRETIKCYSAK